MKCAHSQRPLSHWIRKVTTMENSKHNETKGASQDTKKSSEGEGLGKFFFLIVCIAIVLGCALWYTHGTDASIVTIVRECKEDAIWGGDNIPTIIYSIVTDDGEFRNQNSLLRGKFNEVKLQRNLVEVDEQANLPTA